MAERKKADPQKTANDRSRCLAAILGTTTFLLLAPGIVAGYIPSRSSL